MNALLIGIFSWNALWGLTCEQLSDQQCRKVWSKENKGNIIYGQEKILRGLSKKSELRVASLLDYKALVESYPRLPKDLQKALKGLFSDLEEHLKKENLRKAWIRRLAVIKFQIDSAIKDVAEQRTYKRRPDLKLEGKREEDKVFEDRHELQKDFYKIETELIRAKYEQHPNWKRVKKVFTLAKQDLIKVVNSFPLSKKTKKQMVDKLKAAKLTLPFTDPLLLGADERCHQTTLNATYYRSFNKLTMCAGYFNAYQAEAPMYSVIAHELAHSIDPYGQQRDYYLKSDLAKLLLKVDKENGKIPCDKWRKAKKKVFVEPKKFYGLPKKIMTLTNCLVDRTELKKLTLQSLEEPGLSYSRKRIGWYASPYSFTKLAQDKTYKFDEIIDNQFFEDPSKLSASYEDHVFQKNRSGYLDVNATFWQEYRCQDKKLERKIAFENAIKELQKIHKVYAKTEAAYFGRENNKLQKFKLARPSFENWSDWMARKAFVHFLARYGLEQRRNFVFATNAEYCKKNGLNTAAPELVKIEKKYSNEVHPESRTRRLMIFTDYVAKQMNCTLGKEILSKRQRCEIK